jgi:hypothetical protein
MRSRNICSSSIAATALAAVAVAAALAAVDASAAQSFGRDSVYAWDLGASGNTKSGTSAAAQNFGRDSVFATPGAAKRVATTVNTRSDRYAGEIYGRAGTPWPLPYSRSKAG